MDVLSVIAGALFVLWPVQYRRSIRRIRNSIAAQGGDVAGFDKRLDRSWLRLSLRIAPLAGIALIVLGLVVY